MAVRNRTVVPLLPSSRSADAAGRRPSQPRHPDGLCAAIVIDRQAELPEAFDHHPRVVAFQGPGEQRFALGQRGANQRAVGDALGTRRADGGP